MADATSRLILAADTAAGAGPTVPARCSESRQETGPPPPGRPRRRRLGQWSPGRLPQPRGERTRLLEGINAVRWSLRRGLLRPGGGDARCAGRHGHRCGPLRGCRLGRRTGRPAGRKQGGAAEQRRSQQQSESGHRIRHGCFPDLRPDRTHCAPIRSSCYWVLVVVVCCVVVTAGGSG